MSEIFASALTLFLGAGLGAIFFGGLWWTVGKAVTARAPAAWFLGSLISRMGLTLIGFYWASTGGIARLLFCLLGFMLARQMVMWFTRLPKESTLCDAQGATRAP